MHSSYPKLSTLLALFCVVTICASIASARTKRSSGKSAASKASVQSTVHSSKDSKRTGSRKGSKKRVPRRVASRPRGQQAIDTGRVREIQEALIRAKYMDGEPTGLWDDSTKRALTRFQADNGWQSKVVPDSRALIKLGLGPNYENVINRETSLISRPQVTDPVDTLEPGGGTPRR